MDNNKQSSVEWLFDWIEANMHEDNFNILSAKETAIRMHKEEIVNAWIQATPRNIPKYEAITKDFAEQYYQETYGTDTN
tara:strand:+ start:1094 stop:1330 length:237 start_codon:yes stop_codon:yes gene_type:complete